MIRVLISKASTSKGKVALCPGPSRLRRLDFLHNGQSYYDEIAPLLLARPEGLGLAVLPQAAIQ